MSAFQEAGSRLREQGFQSGDLIGHGWIPSSVDGQSQERSTSIDYLRPDLDDRLAIHAQTLAKRIVFKGKKARGVEVETGGTNYSINARREVILSCGAFQTPQLLMVSGIGDGQQLSALNITVVKDLPGVGKNLQDNPGFGLSFPVKVDTAVKVIRNSSRLLSAIEEYNHKRTGFLTSSGADAVNFEKVKDHTAYNLSEKAAEDLSRFTADWPEVQYWPLTTWPGQDSQTENAATFVAGLIAPLSRGNVSIRSNDMTDAPIIHTGWLTHPTDVEVAIGAVRRMRQFVTTEALRPIVDITHGQDAIPGSTAMSDREILAFIRRQLSTFYHAAGTCKMGQPSDDSAVIDSRAKVFGVDGLRVADLSGVPFLPPGQPQATVYMLAERIADFIVESVK